MSEPAFRYVDTSRTTVSRSLPGGAIETCQAGAEAHRRWLDAGNETMEPLITAALVTAERDRRTRLGHTVSLSSGKTFTVQTRDEVDFRNISGLGTVGIVRQSAGNTTAIVFRDADDVDQTLTPAEAIEMAMKVAGKVDAIYKASWALKDMPAIPADFADDQHWPAS